MKEKSCSDVESSSESSGGDSLEELVGGDGGGGGDKDAQTVMGGQSQSAQEPKTVPVKFQDTWDFSIQNLVPTIYVEGSLHKILGDQCLHEVQDVYCQCEKKEKVKVCRLCYATFSSTTCFKGSLQKVQGKEPETSYSSTDDNDGDKSTSSSD